MLSSDIMRKIRHITIATRRLLSGSLIGDNRSAQKGMGFEFDQMRDYQVGDDVRFIDWHASLRTQSMLVKQYVEERSRTIMLVVDVSHSTVFGSQALRKYDLIAQVSSILALVATYGNDRVGLLLFSDDVELYIPPGRGWSRVHRIMETLFSYTPVKKATHCASACDRLASLAMNDAVVFFISDFIDDTLDARFGVLSKKYDVIAVRCLDEREKTMPVTGIMTVCDIETGEDVMIDIGELDRHVKQRITAQNNFFRRYGIDILDISCTEDYIGNLITFFRRRMRY
ncbi:MAG TPA: DUF58 domain-containing protein [Candidatus Bathyarchaeia archaeon]|nr:DUF58 domain-containing protein [Candidatus Bathyarchaeia archaeon]